MANGSLDLPLELRHPDTCHIRTFWEACPQSVQVHSGTSVALSLVGSMGQLQGRCACEKHHCSYDFDFPLS